MYAFFVFLISTSLLVHHHHLLQIKYSYTYIITIYACNLTAVYFLFLAIFCATQNEFATQIHCHWFHPCRRVVFYIPPPFTCIGIKKYHDFALQNKHTQNKYSENFTRCKLLSRWSVNGKQNSQLHNTMALKYLGYTLSALKILDVHMSLNKCVFYTN